MTIRQPKAILEPTPKIYIHIDMLMDNCSKVENVIQYYLEFTEVIMTKHYCKLLSSSNLN